MTPLIAARGLVKRFGRATALRGIDLEVAGGACLGVLGPNGAGKSTLLRLLAGLARPSSGTLTVAGHRASDRAARGRVGYIGHATFLYPALTARENLIFAARLHGVSDPGDRADAALAREGLTAVAHLAAGACSRGMAQRLSIARGLVHDPEIVILDEPFAGLDRASADRLAARLAAMHREERTLILATHDAAQAAALADAAIVLAAGRIAFETARVREEAGALEKAYATATEDAA